MSWRFKPGRFDWPVRLSLLLAVLVVVEAGLVILGVLGVLGVLAVLEVLAVLLFVVIAVKGSLSLAMGGSFEGGCLGGLGGLGAWRLGGLEAWRACLCYFLDVVCGIVVLLYYCIVIL